MGAGEEIYSYADSLIDLQVTANLVPIPGVVWLLGSGLVGLVGIVRARKKNSD